MPDFKNHPQRSGIFSPTVLLLNYFVVHTELSDAPGAGLCVRHQITGIQVPILRERSHPVPFPGLRRVPAVEACCPACGAVSWLSVPSQHRRLPWCCGRPRCLSRQVLVSFFSRGPWSFLAWHFHTQFRIGLSSHMNPHILVGIFLTLH